MKAITKRRIELGWSISELARRAGMSAGDVGKIESGRLRPYVTQMAKLCRAVGLPLPLARQLFTEVK